MGLTPEGDQDSISIFNRYVLKFYATHAPHKATYQDKNPLKPHSIVFVFFSRV